VETAGNHEVQHKPKIAVDANSDPLADATEAVHCAAFDAGERRIRGTKQECACQTNLLNWLLANALLEGDYVGGYVGEFRHRYKIAAGTLDFATEMYATPVLIEFLLLP